MLVQRQADQEGKSCLDGAHLASGDGEAWRGVHVSGRLPRHEDQGHHTIPHARNRLLPVISRKLSSPTRLSAPCFEVQPILDHACGDDRTGEDEFDQVWKFELVRRLRRRRSTWFFASTSRSCSFSPASAASWMASKEASSRSLRLRLAFSPAECFLRQGVDRRDGGRQCLPGPVTS